jgi:hypothetical protein
MNQLKNQISMNSAELMKKKIIEKSKKDPDFGTRLIENLRMVLEAETGFKAPQR